MATQGRRRIIAQVRAEEPYCWLCGYPIDLARDAQRDPLGSVVDEVIPRSRGGSPLDRANVRHAMRLCNGIRGTKPVTPELQARCREAVERHMSAGLSRRW